MSNWGISSSATPKEKLKAEMSDYLHGLNSTGEISYEIYSELFDDKDRILRGEYYSGL